MLPVNRRVQTENVRRLKLRRHWLETNDSNGETAEMLAYCVSGHYPSSCFYLKQYCFRNRILSPSSGTTYSAGPNREC
jgi:hypothetical protein